MTTISADAILVFRPIPPNAWKAAGLDPDPGVTCLGDCGVATLRRFASMDVGGNANGVRFQIGARAILAALEGALSPDEEAAVRRSWAWYLDYDNARQGQLGGMPA